MALKTSTVKRQKYFKTVLLFNNLHLTFGAHGEKYNVFTLKDRLPQ